MRIFTICQKCVMDNPSSHAKDIRFIPIIENDLYHFKCIKGHDNLLEIQAFKFEILFESGLCAIKDNYFLESVLSLTASVERFYEFFIRIIMKTNGLSNDTFESVFKHIAKQSERQFGAFICIYSLIYKENPPILLNKKSVEFRNKVVHKGYLPNENEVLEYAEEVYNLIKFYYLKLLSDYKEDIFDYLHEIQMQRRINNKDLIDELGVSITGVAPCFAITHMLDLDSLHEKSFTDCFEFIKETSFYG